MRLQLVAVIGALFVLVVSSTVDAQDQPTSSYTKDEIDNRLKDLESKADAGSRMGEFYKRGEVDALLGDLRKSISQSATKTDIETKIDDAQKVFKAALEAAERRNSERKSDLEKRIETVESKIPSFPSWISAAIAALALVVSIASAVVSYTNVNRGAEEARRAVREARADSMIEQWQGLADKIRQVRGVFSDLDHLFNQDGTPNLQNYALIADVGNWYERMADQWHHSTADRDVLRRNGLKNQAQEFWTGVLAASGRLPDLTAQIADWTELRWLATDPAA